MDTSELTIAVLMYFVLPVWLAAGFADYLCHRAANIASLQNISGGSQPPIKSNKIAAQDDRPGNMRVAGAFK
jgi:hypothetical protein